MAYVTITKDLTEVKASLEVVVNTDISEDARIKELMIAGVQKLEEKFSPDVFEYDVEVGRTFYGFKYFDNS